MKKRWIHAVSVFFLLFLITDRSTGTMVIIRSFEQVIQGSELIFEGRVLSKETRLSPTSGMPFTYFTFGIIDIVKGEYPAPTIEIGFMGGDYGEVSLQVSEMQMPRMGETGIYFVQRIDQQQIHPLTGWHQGHFLIRKSEITGTDVVVPAKPSAIMHDTGRQPLIPSAPPSVEDFKQQIRNIDRGQ